MSQAGTDNGAAKPLLRGWFHAVAAAISVVFTAVMLVASSPNAQRMLALLVFGLSMMLLYTVSAVYHIGRWSHRVHAVLRSLDHSNIFVLIAGTYTPLCVVALQGWGRFAMLVSIWALAIGGVFLSVFKPSVPRWVGTALYIIMGWISLLVLPFFWSALSGWAVGSMALGGLLYTIGAVIYAMKRPNPIPAVLGFHEVFHLFVIAGSIVFATVVWIYAVPHAAS